MFPLGSILIEFLVEFKDDKLRNSTFNHVREKNALPTGLINNQFARVGQLILKMTKTKPDERPSIDQVIQQMKKYC